MTPHTPEQIEAAARAMAVHNNVDPDADDGEGSPIWLNWEDDARAALATLTLPAKPEAEAEIDCPLCGGFGYLLADEPGDAPTRLPCEICGGGGVLRSLTISDPPELISARERLEAAAIMATRGQDIADRWAADHPTEIILVHGEREAGLRELKEAAREFARAYAGKGT